MTVKELIEELQKLPQEIDIVVLHSIDFNVLESVKKITPPALRNTEDGVYYENTAESVALITIGNKSVFSRFIDDF